MIGLLLFAASFLAEPKLVVWATKLDGGSVISDLVELTDTQVIVGQTKIKLSDIRTIAPFDSGKMSSGKSANDHIAHSPVWLETTDGSRFSGDGVSALKGKAVLKLHGGQSLNRPPNLIRLIE